jgi:CheY-like chemotaxis protein
VPTILCIDDRRVALEIRRTLLETVEYSVFTAGDGKTARDVSSRPLVCTRPSAYERLFHNVYPRPVVRQAVYHSLDLHRGCAVSSFSRLLKNHS